MVWSYNVAQLAVNSIIYTKDVKIRLSSIRKYTLVKANITELRLTEICQYSK